MLLGCLAGCAPTVTREAPPKLAQWELASAQPMPVRRITRARIPYDRPLPEGITQPLSDRFAIVVIDQPGEWASVREQLGLDPATETLDLHAGIVVGILATIGEPAAGRRWPLRIEKVRVRDGIGQIEAEFSPGIYYPLRSAAFLELAYVPQLRSVRNVQINQQTYRILDPADQH